jgi:hypothetical protein
MKKLIKNPSHNMSVTARPEEENPAQQLPTGR